MNNHQSRAAARSSALLSLALVACSGAHTTDNSQQAWTMQPNGGSGKLLITVPSGAVGTIFAQRDSGPPTSLSSGDAQDFPEASYCLWVQPPQGTAYNSDQLCNIPVQNGQTTTVALGAISFVTPAGMLVAGAQIQSSYERIPQSARTTAWTQNTAPLAFFAGTYALPFVDNDALNVTVTSGAVSAIHLDDVSKSSSAILLPPPASDHHYPDDPTYSGIELSVDGWVSTAIKSMGTNEILVRGGPTSVSQFDSSLYPYNAASIGLAPVGSPSTSIQMGRIEVADVAVTMPDGTVQTVAGTFTANLMNPDNTTAAVLCPGCGTNHGFDGPPGTYRVTVTYTHPVDGSPMTQTTSTTIP